MKTATARQIRHELRNAIRLGVFRKEIDPARRKAAGLKVKPA